jgi:cephalosporin hydroxylase
MLYEFKMALKTLRREGVGSLFHKMGFYFRDFGSAMIFLCRRPSCNAPIGELIDFSFNVIGPSQVKSEILQLAELVQKRQPRVVVEIGTERGGTLFLWHELSHPEAVIVSIDLPGGVHGGGYPFWKTFFYKRFAKNNQQLCLIRADSRSPETLEKLRSLLDGKKIDFLFIDGDHTYNGVKTDFQNYSSFMSPDGMIAFHDVSTTPPAVSCKVDVFWREIRNNYRNVEFIENPDQGWGGIGVLLL